MEDKEFNLQRRHLGNLGQTTQLFWTSVPNSKMTAYLACMPFVNTKSVTAYLLFKECLHVMFAQKTLVTFIVIAILIIASIFSLELVLQSPKIFLHSWNVFLLQSTKVALHLPVWANTISQKANFHPISKNA